MLPRLDRPCPLTAVLAAESNKRRPLLSKLTFTAVTNARSGRSTIQHIQVATNRLTVRRPQYTEHLRSYQQDSYQVTSKTHGSLVEPTIPRTIYKYDKISRICSGSCPKFNQLFFLSIKYLLLLKFNENRPSVILGINRQITAAKFVSDLC